MATGCGGTSSRPSWASKKGEWRQTALKGSTKHGERASGGPAYLHTRDEARRIALNSAELPERVKRY